MTHSGQGNASRIAKSNHCPSPAFADNTTPKQKQNKIKHNQTKPKTRLNQNVLASDCCEIFLIQQDSKLHQKLQGNCAGGRQALLGSLLSPLPAPPPTTSSPLLLLSRRPGTLSQIGIGLAVQPTGTLLGSLAWKEIKYFKALVGAGLAGT